MLSVKNLVKIYKTKAGVDVRALDGVSIDFPDKGMVFLLGRSGSGKSTLLNVAGGLDFPTDGEVIVDGRSSKEFTVSDFDGYRNSCVGFVFQEFNILNEFNIEQNIALALQLQHKPNSSEDVENILKLVDLSGVGKRKPNTLSGGQKQRVAIARALIKDPKIIMADEPTGALDSATGKQVLDTLKKLSETRLVVVVTHDRDFAFEYGDRIIEMADGKIISDISKVVETFVKEEEKNVTFIEDNVVKVNDWSKVSDDEAEQIITALRRKGGSSYITTDEYVTEEVKQKEKDNSIHTSFKDTDKTVKRPQEKGDIKFIKAKLPTKNAFRMAFDSLRQKPIRLTFTILLSVVAFIFFGVASMFMLYNQDYSIITAMESSYYDSIVCKKEYDGYYISAEINSKGQTIETKKYDRFNAAYSKEDLEALNQNSEGLKFAGILDMGAYRNDLDSVEGYFPKTEVFAGSYLGTITRQHENYFVIRGMTGFTDCGQDYLTDCGYSIYGNFPRNYSEIVVSEYIYSLYSTSGYVYGGVRHEILSKTDLIGKRIKFGGINFTISGIVDVGEVPERFQELYNEETKLNAAGIIKLKNEFSDYLKNSFHTLGIVSEDFYSHFAKDKTVSEFKVDERSVYGMKLSETKINNYIDKNYTVNVFTEKSVWKNDYAVNAYDLNGNARNLTIGEKEIMLSSSYIMQYVKFSGNNFCPIFNKIYELGLENQETYAEFLENCKNYNAGVLSLEGKLSVIDFLFSEYETLMGYPMTFPQTIYMRSYIYNGWTANDFAQHPEVPSDANYELNVVGFYFVTRGYSIDSLDKFFVHDNLCEEFGERYSIKSNSIASSVTYYADFSHNPQTEIYGRIITPTQNTKSQSMFILSNGFEGARNAMYNSVYKNATEIASVVNGLKDAFYIAGGIFGLFAILMLFNFISVTITSKMKEIGILRAVGARSQDVFKIFMMEALLITSACFIISSILSVIACAIINAYAAGLYGMAALEFTIINFVILLVASMLVAFIATVWPVSRASNKAPVESIRSI